jgi:alpha-1,2-mannosyltransferase
MVKTMDEAVAGTTPYPSVRGSEAAPAAVRSGLPTFDAATMASIGFGLIAAGLAAFRLSRPAGLLYGNSFDTSIYLGSAIRLVHGALPYRDFVLLQPPGVLLAMSPFALLSDLVGSRTALIIVNACTPLLAFADVVLVGRLVRHLGWRAAFVACGLMAVFPFFYEALLNGMIEPLMDLLCLIGALIVFEGPRLRSGRRLVLGGVLFGLAGSVLVAAVVPVLVVAALATRQVRRRLLPFVGGLAAGFLAPALPFLVAAPGPFVSDVILAQLGRAAGGERTPIIGRLEYMTFGGNPAEAITNTLLICAFIVLGLVVVRRRLTQLEWFALATAVLMVGLQFAIATYWDHFSVMLLPYLAMLLGVSATRLASVRRGWVRHTVLTVAVAALGILLFNQSARIEAQSGRDYGSVVNAIVPSGQCALALPFQLLVMSDRFSSNRPGCPVLVDGYATKVAYRNDPAKAAALLRDAVSHCDYLVQKGTVGKSVWGTPATPVLAYLAQHFHPVSSGGLLIYVRDGFPLT